jgi:hypothetical protein
MTNEFNTKIADAIPTQHDDAGREMTLREYIEHTLPASHRARKELDRAMRALCGCAMAAEAGQMLDGAARAYHSQTVAEAKRWVFETSDHV